MSVLIYLLMMQKQRPILQPFIWKIKGSNFAAALENENFESQATEQLGAALQSSRCARSQDIIKARWLDDNKATLHDLAAKYKCICGTYSSIRN